MSNDLPHDECEKFLRKLGVEMRVDGEAAKPSDLAGLARGIGGWQLVPYAAQAGTAVKINLTNGGQDAITVGTTGYILGIPTPTDADCKRTAACQANQTALDNLNDESFPIPGETGSPFTPVKVNKTLQPGESVLLKLQ